MGLAQARPNDTITYCANMATVKCAVPPVERTLCCLTPKKSTVKTEKKAEGKKKVDAQV